MIDSLRGYGLLHAVIIQSWKPAAAFSCPPGQRCHFDPADTSASDCPADRPHTPQSCPPDAVGLRTGHPANPARPGESATGGSSGPGITAPSPPLRAPPAYDAPGSHPAPAPG